MSEKKELNKKELEKAAGGTDENLEICGPLYCENCGADRNFAYNPSEATGYGKNVKAYCCTCGAEKWIKLGIG